MRLRSHLFVLVLGTILPLVGFTAWLVLLSHGQTRAATERGLLETGRALMVAVDREIAGSVAALGVLAMSEHLAAGDLKAFDRAARSALVSRSEWETIALYDPDGRQLMNLHRPFGSPLPRAGSEELISRVVATRAAAVSGLFRGRVTGRMVVQVGVPVLSHGTIVHVLGAVLAPAAFAQILMQETLRDESVATLIDRNYLIIARTRKATEFVGQRVTPGLEAAMRAAQEGPVHGKTKEGTTAYGAFSRSGFSGWTVALAVPRKVVDAPLRRSFWLLIGLALLSVAAAVVTAGIAARRLTRPILSLVATTARLLTGERFDLRPSSVTEVDQVATAMAAMAAERATADADSTRRRHEAEALAATARLLTESLDVAEVGARTVAAVQPLFRVEWAILRVLEPSGDLRAIAVSAALQPEFEVGHVLPEGVGLMGRAVADGRAVWSSDVVRDFYGHRTEDVTRRMIQSGIHAGLAVPLRSKGVVIGALGIRDQTGRIFLEHEVSLLTTFGDQAALALENARLYEETRRQASLLQTSLESISHGLSVFDRDLRLAAWNARFLDFVQLPEEFGRVGRPLEEFFRHGAMRGDYGPGAPEDHVARAMARVRSARPRRFELQRADGTLIDVRTDYMPDGGVVTTYTDITERKRSEETVVKLSRAVEQTADIVMVCNRDGVIEYVNPTFEAVTGYAHGEVVGRTPRLLKSGRHDVKFYQQMWQTMLAGRAYRGVLTNSKKNGTLYYEAKTVTPVKDETGTIVNFISTGTDITEQRQTEEALRRTESQLQQNQKMEAVGRLAGGVAHDFNNLLTVILGRCAMLLEARSPDDPARRTLELIERTAERAAGLTRQLLAFSRRQVLQPRILDLNPIVSGMAGMLRRLIGEDVELRMDLFPGLGVVRADPGQIEQIVMNLAVNARDAMPRGGRLVISTENVPAAAPQRGYVVLKVSDTGVGMDAETQERIFEPFFTTKETGKGTGLGLATVHGIVEQHGGTSRVDSAPGRGTTFTLAFPIVEGVPEEPAAPPKLVTPSMSGHETILLVEDEAAIRSLAREILEANGYVVLEAGDGATALDRCARHEGPIHLVLTDVVMPAISGPDLARRVKAARPDVKILYISGYTAEKLDHHGVFGGEVVLLEKPFTPAMLMAKIREVLG